jgi:hypothetical protein
LKADLKASTEVPPNNGSGTGTLTATLNTETNEFKYHVEFAGLTGPVVAAQVPVKGSPIASPIDGSATLTPEQAKDLTDGKWYFNLHTSANPRGEVRGQVVKAE